jgi:RecB family endonuclease NucS
MGPNHDRLVRRAAEQPWPCRVRLVIARCSADYVGRLTAHLPEATCLLVQKADGSLLVHSDTGGYKPLMWMVAPWPCVRPARASAVRRSCGGQGPRVEAS